MILLFHITIAILSIVYNSLIYFSPSKSKLSVAYGLVALTLASGTYLVWDTKSNILQTCITGLLYVGVSFYCIAVTRNKLAEENSQAKKSD